MSSRTSAAVAPPGASASTTSSKSRPYVSARRITARGSSAPRLASTATTVVVARSAAPAAIARVSSGTAAWRSPRSTYLCRRARATPPASVFASTVSLDAPAPETRGAHSSRRWTIGSAPPSARSSSYASPSHSSPSLFASSLSRRRLNRRRVVKTSSMHRTTNAGTPPDDYGASDAAARISRACSRSS